MGVHTVYKLDEKEYAEFLEKRREELAQQLKLLDDKRQSKMLRTG